MLVIAIIFSLSGQNEMESAQPEFEIKLITSVESIVPLGLGRSRLIYSNSERN